MVASVGNHVNHVSINDTGSDSLTFDTEIRNVSRICYKLTTLLLRDKYSLCLLLLIFFFPLYTLNLLSLLDVTRMETIMQEYPESLVKCKTQPLQNVYISKKSIEEQVQNILAKNVVISPEKYVVWLLKAVSLIDLTTLSGDDTRSNVLRLCIKAANPLSTEILKQNQIECNSITTAAVCVYPSRVKDAYEAIKTMGLLNDIQIASVATGFPSGLYPLDSRLQEIKYAIAEGATEIDIVLDRSLVLMGKWDAVYEEVRQMKKACGAVHLKAILGVGELGSYENVYKASMVSMLAGADFIKTSTGKEAVNATLPIGLIMCRAIRHYYNITGVKVGLKPAGGIKTARDAVNWLVLVHSELGPEWLTPKLFRIGASSLLGVIETTIKECQKTIVEQSS